MLRVGNLSLDLDRGTVTIGGEVRQLRPGHLKLLRVLVAEAPATVSHDEILAVVWDGRHVGGDVVRRAVASLRRDLGDDAASPSFIQTVPREGYRWIADTTECSAPDGAPEPPNEEGPNSRPGRGLRPWVLAGGVAGLVALTWWGARSALDSDATTPDGGPVPPDLVVVTGLESSPDPSDVTATLVRSLQEIDGLSIRVESSDGHRDAESLLALGDRPAPTTGEIASILESSPLLVVRHHASENSVELAFAAGSGAPVHTSTLDYAAETDLLNALSDGVVWVVEQLADMPRDGVPAVWLFDATARNPAALVAYSRGAQALGRGAVSESVPYLETALLEDPEFPLARIALARALWLLGRPMAEVESELSRARLETLESGERLRASAETAQIRGRSEEALALWRLYRDRFPTRPEGWVDRAILLASSRFDHLGCVEELEMAARRVTPRPIPDLAIEVWVARCLVASGRPRSQIEGILASLADRGVHGWVLHLRLALGDRDPALAMLASDAILERGALLRLPPSFYRTVLALEGGNIRDRHDTIAQLAESALDERLGPSRRGLGWLLAVAPLAGAAGLQSTAETLLDRALTDLEELLREPDFDRRDVEPSYALATILALCRVHGFDEGRARAVSLADLVRQPPPDAAATIRAYRELLFAEVALVHGETGRALEHVWQSRSLAESAAARILLWELAEAGVRPEHREEDRARVVEFRARAWVECPAALVCYDRMRRIVAVAEAERLDSRS